MGHSWWVSDLGVVEVYETGGVVELPQEREIALLFTLHPHPHARFLVALLDQLVVDRAGEDV